MLWPYCWLAAHFLPQRRGFSSRVFMWNLAGQSGVGADISRVIIIPALGDGKRLVKGQFPQTVSNRLKNSLYLTQWAVLNIMVTITRQSLTSDESRLPQKH
jgi:hypothetical protein